MTEGFDSVVAGFPDPAAGPFAALGIDVQLFACIPYPQHTLSPGLVFAGHQWAVDGPENGAAVQKNSGHCSNNQSGARPNTQGAGEGLLNGTFHQPDCDHRANKQLLAHPVECIEWTAVP